MTEPAVLLLSDLLAPDGLTPKNRLVFDYWQSLRKNGEMPSRADFKPTAIGPALDRLCLFDVKPGEWLVCRLAGSAVTQALGIELTKKDFRTYTPPHYWQPRLDVYHRILSGMGMRNLRRTRTTAHREVEWQDLTLPFGDVQDDGSQQVLIMSDFGKFDYQERVVSVPEALGPPLKSDFVKL